KAPQGGDLAKEMEDKIGLKPEDIERISVVAPDLMGMMDRNNPSMWVVVATTKPYDRKAILEKCEKSMGAKATEGKAKGQTTYEFGKNKPVVLFPSDRILLLGTSSSVLESCLDKVGKSSGPLASSISAAGGKHHFVVGINVEKLSGFIKPFMQQ